MAKKAKPNLKDYLRTGNRVVANSGDEPEMESRSEPGEKVRGDAFLDLLTPPDLKMWKSLLDAGITVQLLRLDTASMRKDFQDMDKSRFSCYTLTQKGEPLRPVRLASQIHDPLSLLLKWDETGVLTVYDSNV